MPKGFHLVEPNEKEIWYFVYSYIKNECKVISALTNIEENIEYYAAYHEYTVEPHFTASAMLSKEEKSEVDKAIAYGRRAEAYNIMKKYSRIILIGDDRC